MALLRIVSAWLALLAIFAALPAHAQDFPDLSGRVVDNADLLDAGEETALNQQLAALEANSTRQMVVVTLPDLQGYEIEDYGYRLGRTWGIGQDEDGAAEKDNGVLLIVAPNERKVRIEVGYGLEGIMTDALSSIIIQNDILPRFRDEDYPGGIAAGVDAIVTQLALPEDEARAVAAETEADAREGESAGNIFMVIFWLAILAFFVLPMFFSGFRKGKKGRRYRASGAAEVLLWGAMLGSSSGRFSGSSWGGGGFGGGFGGGGGSFGGGGASGGW